MKKNLLFTLLSVLAISVYAQQPKSETFSNYVDSNPGSSFFTGQVVGEHATWNITVGREDTSIDGRCFTIRQNNGGSIVSETISGGIGDFRVQLFNRFNGGARATTTELVVNGVVQGSITNSSTTGTYVFEVSNVNIAGDFTLEVRNSSVLSDVSVAVDNITWTANGETLSTSNVEANATNVYPNPFSNEINIQGADNVKQAELYNVSGQKVLNAQGNSTINVDAALPKGVYFLRLSGDNGFQETHKLIKE